MQKYYVYKKHIVSEQIYETHLLNENQTSEAYKFFDTSKHVVSTTKFNHPTWDESELREMTDIELFQNEIREARAGEYIDEDGEYQNVPQPTHYHKWDSDQLNWLEDEELKMTHFRNLRAAAFIEIDKYQLVLIYNSLTAEQKAELEAYRAAWLNVTETFEIPDKPEWMV